MSDLWGLVWGRPEVDPSDLAGALEAESVRSGQDFRTRLLIRDSAEVLKRYWGDHDWATWLSRSPARDRIEAIRSEDLGPPGFHLEPEQLVPATDPETVREYFQELGTQLPRPVRLSILGAIPLILAGHLRRATSDIDIVDELPEEIRAQRPLLNQLKVRYRLALTHFASHYLPTGWESRLRSVGTFGNLQVDAVDPIDIFLGKLFSNRTKDLDDLRVLKSPIDRPTLTERLLATTQNFLRDSTLRPSAVRNWYILYGEPLPTEGDR